MTPPNSIRRIIIHNPFDRSQRTVEDLELADGMAPLATFITEKDGQQIITVVNGEVIPRAQRALRLLRPNDSLVIAPVLQGGGSGGGKGILRMVAMIAVLAASIFVPPLLGLGTLATALVGAGIAIGGGLIVNALIPATQPKAQQDTAIYGWNGPQMTARQGLVINKGYGIFGEAGNVISSYIYTAQDKQYMNLLISFGWGPARSITQIKINDNPLENYKGVQVEKRLGFNEQDPVSFFRDVVNEFPQSTKIRVDSGSVTVNGHGTDTEAAEIEVNFPKGLWAGPNPDGSYDPWTVFYKVEYSLHGSGVFTTALSPRVTADAGATPQWLAIVQDQFSGGPGNVIVVAASNNNDHFEGEPGPAVTSVSPFDPFGVSLPAENRTFRSVWTRNHLNDPNNVASPPGAPVKTVSNWSQITDSVTGRVTTIIRHVTRINFPSPGQWDLRVTKLGSGQNTSVPTPHDNDSTRRGEEFWLTSIREIAHDALSYPNMVLLGVRALATDQLSGSGINVTAVVDHGDPESLGYKHTVANDRPQAYYRLNEASGTVCNDSSGRGNNATYSATGVTLQQAGLITASADLAAAFDGAGTTKITTPSFAVGTDYCIEFWVKPTTWNGALLAGDGTSNGIFIDAATGKVNLFFGGVGRLSATVIPLNQVSHIAVCVSAAFARFVINGKLDANSYGSMPSATFAVMLQSLNGIGDEIALYVPSIDITRFVTRYRFGISQRNKMEDFTGDQQASASFDALTNPLYGGGIDPDAYINIDSFVDWSSRCNELVDNGAGGTMFRHSFNAVFDTTGNLQDGLDKISVMGRARILQVGGRKYTAIQDKPSTPVQLFGMGSIVKGSFKETWLALADRANSVDIQFSNSADSYKRDLTTVFDQAQIDSDGAVVPATTVDLFGAVTEAECWHHGSYLLAGTRLLIHAVQFDADVEAIALTMGDQFLFSHDDVPQWGLSGRIDGSVDASNVTLDQQVTMDPLKSYQLLCQLPTVKRYTGNITSFAGLRVFISGWANTARVMRLKQGAVDVEITNSGAGFVDVASIAGLSAASADLWDLDVIETLNVVNPLDGLPRSALQTTSPFSAQPVQFDLYAFGEVNNNVKAFRCVRLQRKTDQQFTIYGLEYNDAVYTDGVPILPAGADPIPVIDASNLVADETFDLVGERWQDYLRVGWRPGALAVGADIYLGINGNVEKFHATVNNGSSILIPTTVGQTVLARVVGFDVKGNRANYNTAPTVTRTMDGVTTNLLVNSTWHATLAYWDLNFRFGLDQVFRGFDEDGFVQYQVVNSNLTTEQKFLGQLSLDPTEWAVGDFVMLSGYVQSGGGMTGHLALEIVFNGAGTTVRAEWDLATATTGPTRINTPANTQVPVGTTSIDVTVRIRNAGSGVSVAIGKLIEVRNLLFEVVSDGTVSTPSKWADNVDNGTNAANTLGGGSSSTLANQGSMLPIITGLFAVTVTDTTAHIAWTSLKIRGTNKLHITSVQDGTFDISGLTGGTAYKCVPFYDILTTGQVMFITGKSSSAGTPAAAYTTLGQDAAHAQIQDWQVPLGTISFTTNAAGVGTPTSAPPSGGRAGGYGANGLP